MSIYTSAHIANYLSRLRSRQEIERAGAIGCLWTLFRLSEPFDFEDERDFFVVVTELLENAKNDKRGEISIAASIVLADFALDDRWKSTRFSVSTAVTEAYHECKGNWSTADADPALRLCFAKAFERDLNFFTSLSPASFGVRPKPFAEKVADLIHSVHANDDRQTARSIIYFEYLDNEFEPGLLKLGVGSHHTEGVRWTEVICAEARKRWWRFW